jgi:uncharacterized membrane protein YqaE (UPF0057 family)
MSPVRTTARGKSAVYLIASLIPPLAALFCGKPFQAILCLVLMLTLIGRIPAAVWACLIVSARNTDRRNEKLIQALQASQGERR